jgi:hypothetical protein
MLKAYNRQEDITEDELALDQDFLDDASLFLRTRGREKGVLTPDEIKNKFLEHMRYHNTNELTTLRDLHYAQNASEEEKQAFARLLDVYDKVDTDFSGRMMADYGMSILTAPSTYAGILTGGAGKAATVAGIQGTKLGIRKLLYEGGKSALKAAGVEGAIGAGQGAMQTATRVKTGLEEDFTLGRTAMTAAGSALTGGVIGFPTGIAAASRASKANEIVESAKLAAADKARTASAKSDEIIQQAGPLKVDKVKQTLNALDPDEVFQGRQLRRELSPSDTMEAALGSDVVRNIAAATIRVQDRLKLKEGDRITTGITNLIREGDDEILPEIAEILREHNLNYDQFSLVYLAEISDAGRTLQAQGQVKRLLGELDVINRAGKSPFTKEEAKALTAGKKAMTKAYQVFKDFDTLGVASLTVQPATTMRNTIGGGFRMAVDATTRAMDNMIENTVHVATLGKKGKLRNPFDGTLDMAQGVFDPYESRAIRTLLSEKFPTETSKLFRDAADLAAQTKGETALVTIGRKINFLNTASDNVFKQAMLSASLKRQLRDKSDLDLIEVLKNADYDKITDDMFREAVEDAYKFTYQSSDVGPIGRFAINAQQKYPFIISSFMPFPRFVANQLKFQYEHAPLIGMMRLFNNSPREVMAKQMTGFSMLGAAYMWRAKQGTDAEWFEIKKNDDDYFNGKALYGPMSPFMVMADMIYRTQTKTLPREFWKYYGPAMAEATLGSTFRTGMGLAMLDRVMDGTFVSDMTEFEQRGAEFAGNLLGRYMIPLGAFGVAKDAYPLLFDDQRAANVPATRDGDMNMFDYMYKLTTRSLPDLPIATLTDGTFTTRDYDVPAVSPFKTGTLRPIDPLEKHIIGATTTRKNVVQKEMSRLGLKYYDLYRRDRDDRIDFYTRQELARATDDPQLGTNMQMRLTALIRSPNYQAKSKVEKELLLMKEAGKIVADAKKIAKGRLDREAKFRGDPYSRTDIAQWNAASVRERDLMNEIFIEQYGGTDIADQKDLYFDFNGTRINVMTWAATNLKGLKSE